MSQFRKINLLSSYLLLAVLVTAPLFSCSNSTFTSPRQRPRLSEPSEWPSSDPTIGTGIPAQIEQGFPQVQIDQLPWKCWDNGTTLQGANFSNERLSAGDALLDRADYPAASAQFKMIRPQNLDQEESVALRIASAELLAGDAPRAISTLSRFYQDKRLKESQIRDCATLLFGYAFGQAGNLEQSVAWFSQATEASQTSTRESAASGIRALLRVISDVNFEQLAAIWRSNEAISNLVASERFIRQTRQPLQLSRRDYFWIAGATPPSSSQSSNTSLNAQGNSPSGADRRIIALLPLSGRFAKMGEAVKIGLEIAAEKSAAQGVAVHIEARDYGQSTDDLKIAGEVDQIAEAGTFAIVGPLLSEQARAVSDNARRRAVPTVILSKGGEASLGEGVYRFGLTNDSQADSLVTALLRVRSNPRLSLIYPTDEAGQSFAASFQEALRKNNIVPLAQYSYSKGNSAQMLASVADIEVNRPDFIVFGDNLKAASQFFGALSDQTRQAVVPVGTALWDNPIELTQSKTILNGAILVSPFFNDATNPEITEFTNSYRQKTGKNPDFFAAQGFDVGMLLAAAQAGASVSLPSLYRGITGVARRTSWGEIARELPVIRLERGKLVLLTSLPPAQTIVEPNKDPLLPAIEHESPSVTSDPVVSE